MAARFARIAIACWLIAAPASLASANPFAWLWGGTKKVAADIARDTKLRNRWPEPYVHADRRAAKAAFGTMIEHGWRQQNLIGDYYFEDDGTELSEAGRRKVRWIVFEAPAQHRVIYVQMADDPQVTAGRVIEVQELVVELAPHDRLPPVLQTHIRPQGWPAERVDVVGRKFHEATPVPMLPAATSSNEF